MRQREFVFPLGVGICFSAFINPATQTGDMVGVEKSCPGTVQRHPRLLAAFDVLDKWAVLGITR